MSVLVVGVGCGCRLLNVDVGCRCRVSVLVVGVGYRCWLSVSVVGVGCRCWLSVSVVDEIILMSVPSSASEHTLFTPFFAFAEFDVILKKIESGTTKESII